MKLYVHPMSQHARRVLMICKELGLEPATAPIAFEKGEHHAPEFVKLNPAHAVPVLDDDGFILAESHAIMRYLCQKHGGERFYPTDPAQRALVDQWLDWNHCRLNPPVQTLAIQTFFAGNKRDPVVVEKVRGEALAALSVLDQALPQRRGIGGETSLADIAVATTVALYEMCQADLDKTPGVRDWFAKMKTLPTFAATVPRVN
jgi:glutathione S-transferase